MPECSDIRYALALVAAGGIGGVWREDAVQEILVALDKAPRRFRAAAAARALKRAVARDTGRSVASLPARLDRLKRVGLYEQLRSRSAAADLRDPGRLNAFDRHSRRFAIENGVCPRCARCVDFAAGARCGCGWGTAGER
jgi:hypothetical protein